LGSFTGGETVFPVFLVRCVVRFRKSIPYLAVEHLVVLVYTVSTEVTAMLNDTRVFNDPVQLGADEKAEDRAESREVFEFFNVLSAHSEILPLNIFKAKKAEDGNFIQTSIYDYSKMGHAASCPYLGEWKADAPYLP
jgi:hypothetical protein